MPPQTQNKRENKRMRKSTLIAYAGSAGLTVKDVTIAHLNPVIFAAKLVETLPGLTKQGGKHFQIDTKRNKAIEVTAETIADGAKKAIKKQNDKDGYLAIAEQFGLVTSVTFEAGDSDDDAFGCTALTAVTAGLDMKITDVKIVAQNDIIFATTGINELDNLTKSGKDMYKLDTKRNTATLINPKMVAKQAKKDLLASKSTDYTQLADNFNLISAITFEKRD